MFETCHVAHIFGRLESGSFGLPCRWSVITRAESNLLKTQSPRQQLSELQEAFLSRIADLPAVQLPPSGGQRARKYSHAMKNFDAI